MKNTSTDLAYMAGFFDGEGYVGILKRKKPNWNIEYFLQLSIGQKDGATLDWVKEHFGGNTYLVKRDGTFYWTASNEAARKLIEAITPFLKYKKPQAELALEFYTGRILKRPITKEELERREILYLKMKALKKVFTKSVL